MRKKAAIEKNAKPRNSKKHAASARKERKDFNTFDKMHQILKGIPDSSIPTRSYNLK